MRMILGYRVGATALAAIMAATGAMARSSEASLKCAKPDEVSAIQAAAIQQQLMVAALTCNEIARFNSFQTNFGPELRTSDATLAKMFKRLYGARQGESEYHAFKTRLANDSSIKSIHDNVNYCQRTGSLLSAALMPAKPTLVTFVSVVQVVEESPVNSCAFRVAVNPAATAAPVAGLVLPVAATMTTASEVAIAPANGAPAASNVTPRPRPEQAAANRAAPAAMPGKTSQQ